MILDGVIGSAGKQASDCGPFVAEPGVSSDDGLVLFRRERSVLDLRRELITPAKPARLAGAARNGLANQRPIPGSMLLHELL